MSLSTPMDQPSIPNVGTWHGLAGPCDMLIIHNTIPTTLTSALQTSYRGELCAILHMFQTAGTPTWIKCDCKSVVDLTNSILAGEELDVAELTDGDLRQKLRILAASHRKDVFRIT